MQETRSALEQWEPGRMVQIGILYRNAQSYFRRIRTYVI